MKKLAFCLLGCVMWAGEILAGPTWLTSLPDAQAQAKKEGKMVLMEFTASDWCIPCKRLDGAVLEKPEFEQYASSNLVLVVLDFPEKRQPKELKDANQALYDHFSVEGFPTLIALKPDGGVAWRNIGYKGGGPESVITNLEAAKIK